MRKVVAAVAISSALLFGAVTAGYGNTLGDLLNTLVQAADQAARQKAYKKWLALPQDVLTCLGQSYGIDVNALIQRGIGPDHRQVKPYVQQCQAAVAAARQRAADEAERQRQAAEEAERARIAAAEAERQREHDAQEAAERKREAERVALAKFKTDVKAGRKGYPAMTRSGRSSVCLEEGADADVIVFALKAGKIQGAISYLANGEVLRAEAGVAAAHFERGDCALLIATSRGMEGALPFLDRGDLGAKPAEFWIEPEKITAWRPDFQAAQAAEAERQRKAREEALVREQKQHACLVETAKAGYFAQVCMSATYEMRSRADLADGASRAADALRAKLTVCSDDDLVAIRAKARGEAARILASGAIGPFADLKSGAELECKKSAARNDH